MSRCDWPPRFVNRANHACGCVTEFDTVAWHSVARERCGYHAHVEAHSLRAAASPTAKDEP